MEKRYCDLCGKEMTGKSLVGLNSKEIQAERLRIVLTVGLDGKFSGDVCADCVMKELKKAVK